MNRKDIPISVERRLYAESMGRCMNPECEEELLFNKYDIIEKAHIIPYCDSKDNSFENLIILCPNCHKKFDKTDLITKDAVISWKKKRKEEMEKLFSVKFETFDELKEKIVPLLSENNIIYKNYYLENKKKLWDIFEPKVLISNKKMLNLIEKNIDLFQDSKDKNYSNREIVNKFIMHIKEFESTRDCIEKNRFVLFPQEINSIFGIEPMKDSLFPSVESLEALVSLFYKKGLLKEVCLDGERAFIELANNDIVFLDDTPRLRQLYNDHDCFRKTHIRLDSLNFALKYLKKKGIPYSFCSMDCLTNIYIKYRKYIFVYEYCISKEFLYELDPEDNSVIVNLHNWNGENSISSEAYESANGMNVELLTMDGFYKHVNSIK